MSNTPGQTGLEFLQKCFGGLEVYPCCKSAKMFAGYSYPRKQDKILDRL